jgi:hypothetical protein
MVVRGERIDVDCSEIWRKGSARFGSSKLPLEARLLQHDDEVDALFPNHSTGSGMVPISNAKRTPARSCRCGGETTERLREIDMEAENKTCIADRRGYL